MWLGEMITDKGIGNGVSLIIFCGIMVRLPTRSARSGSHRRNGQPWQVLVLIVAFFATVIGIIFVTLGQRKIPIQHVRKIVGNKMTQGGTSYLPFRVASAGVIPIIFALSIQLLPLTFAQFVPATSSDGHVPAPAADWISPGKNPITGLVYAAIIVFFTYFYTAVTMNVEADRRRSQEVRLLYSRHPSRQADDGVPRQGDDAHHTGRRFVPRGDRAAAILDSGDDRNTRRNGSHSSAAHRSDRRRRRVGHDAGH